MTTFSPQLINTLSQFFLRKGRDITGGDIETGSITKEKLAFPTVNPSQLTPLEEGLNALQADLEQLAGSVTQSGGSFAAQIASLQSSVSSLQDLLTALSGRVTDVEDTLAAGVATEELRVVDENDPTQRIIITLTDGVVTDVTREII